MLLYIAAALICLGSCNPSAQEDKARLSLDRTNAKLQQKNRVLLKALREMAVGSQYELAVTDEKAVGSVPPDQCWWHDGYKEDCPAGCVWTHFARGDGMCNAPNGAAERSRLQGAVMEEKAVGSSVYHPRYEKTWCQDDRKLYDSSRNTPYVSYAECEQKCEGMVTCNYFLHGERVMDGSKNRCVTWESCDIRSTYNDGTPMIYEREVWRSPWGYMTEEEAQDAAILIG